MYYKGAYQATGNFLTDGLRFVGGGLTAVFGGGSSGSGGIDPATQNFIIQMQVQQQAEAQRMKQYMLLGGMGLAALIVLTAIK